MFKCIIVLLLSFLTITSALAQFAWDTQIKMADGQLKSIQKISVNEEVADLDSKSTMKKISQGSTAIGYSSGMPTIPPEVRMMSISLEGGKNLVVGLNQILVVSSQLFKRARTLNVTDKLMSSDGTPVAILSIAIDNYRGGVHAISSKSNLSPDNCYIANGIWVGSQKHQLYWNANTGIQTSSFFDDIPLTR